MKTLLQIATQTYIDTLCIQYLGMPQLTLKTLSDESIRTLTMNYFGQLNITNFTFKIRTLCRQKQLQKTMIKNDLDFHQLGISTLATLDYEAIKCLTNIINIDNKYAFMKFLKSIVNLEFND